MRERRQPEHDRHREVQQLAARPDLEQAIGAAETALVWIESPCNPTWEVIDIAAATRLAHAAGALLNATADDAWRQVGEARWLGGAVLGPFEAWLLIRGLRTLYLRVRRASETALASASHFEGHEKLDAVLYPGLSNHPGHAVAARQMSGGFGGMLSVLVGVESLIEHRATIEGPESLVPENMLRLSVGIEDAGELIADLEQMLAVAS